jgi:2-polyprenyl-6-methoxyphenol hydroxylase-like FAD-dependent oxidoreductase
MQFQVLISGAGPVGLTLAMDLARRGVRVGIVELRKTGELPSVKCNHVAARTMESFRLLGIADEIRNSGLPRDYPNDCVYRTTVTGDEIARIPIPSAAERGTAFDGPDTWWPTPEPAHRINQIYLEPILFASASRSPNITIYNECELIAAEQDQTGVSATIRDLANGTDRTIHAQYLIGCDGSRSLIRNLIGAKLAGDAVVQRAQSTYIRAPKLLSLIPGRPGWMNLSLNPRRSGNTVAIDGKETWLIHNYLYEHETDFDAIDRDRSIRTILGVGADFEYEIISKEDWIGRRLLADKFRDRRIFICGDSAHLWVPYAGYGMNAGVADAMNLSWLLSATIDGWANASMLDAYAAERGPITEQVSHFAMNHALGAIRHRREVPAAVEALGEEGQLARAQFGRAVYDLNVRQYCCGGLNFGYFYDQSPIIMYDGEKAPSYTIDTFTSSTIPGCRLPHFWLANRRSIYDALGLGFSLLRFNPSVDIDPLVQNAAHVGIPLKILDIRQCDRLAVFKEDLILARPDFHIAWRGNGLPDNLATMIGKIQGRV